MKIDSDLVKESTDPRHDLAACRERLAELENRDVERARIEYELQGALHDLRVYQEELRTQNENLRQLQDQVEAARRKYQDLYENAPVGYVSFDYQGRILDINQTGVGLLRRGVDNLVNYPLWIFMVHNQRNAFWEHLRQVYAGQAGNLEIDLKLPDGDARPVELLSAPVRNERGGILHARAVFQDISWRRETEKNLKLSALVIENAHEGVIITDRDNHIVSVNPCFTRTTGYQPEEVLGHTPAVLRSGQHPPDFYQRLWRELQAEDMWQGEIWNRRKDGEVYPEWLNISVIRDEQGEVTNYVGIFSDLSVREDVRKRLHHLAYYDSLTDLPNRHLFHDRLQQHLDHARRQNGGMVALLFLDLDRFKLINDTLGHAIGDQLLIQTTQRLRGVIRPKDTLARMGGDVKWTPMSRQIWH